MNPFVRALSAEALKVRRTLALWIVLLAPVFVVLLVGFGVVQRAEPPAAGGWRMLAGYSLSFWAGFLLPLLVALEAALLAGLEHGANAWKHLYALPTSHHAVYGAKLVVALALVGLGTAVLFAFVVLGGAVLQPIVPTFGFDAPAPWRDLLWACGRIYLATWGLLAVQHAVSLHWPSFTVAVGFGIAAWFTTVVVGGSRWLRHFPWNFPKLALDPDQAARVVVLSLACALVAALVGAVLHARRDVTA